MTPVIRGWLIVVLATPALCGWLTAAAIGPAQPGTAATQTDPDRSDSGVASAAIATDKAIRQFEKRVAETPQDYLSYTILGQLHARRARETGDLDAYGRAEAAFQRALDVNRDHVPAMLGLAAALVSQHRFSAALRMARTALHDHPGNLDALVVIADASVEIGRYQDAEEALDELRIKVPDEPSVLARLAHLAELKGKHGSALQILQRAAAKELEEEGSGETAAWYHTRIGALLFRTGKLDEASRSFDAALRLFDGYYMALNGLADVRAAKGQEDEAISLLERVLAKVPHPASLVDLGDLYLKKGRVADAERVHREAESIAQRSGSYKSAYRRELAMFYANHDRHLQQALELARRDWDSRPDIYGYDMLAWALYKNKRLAEAARAMTNAMALGTQDAALFEHAGLIEYRRGRASQALVYLNAAHALCPYMLTDEAKRVRSGLLNRAGNR